MIDRKYKSFVIPTMKAWLDRTTFDLIQQGEEMYLGYIVTCHIPVFAELLEWGTSIRSAWIKDNDKPMANIYTEIKIEVGEIKDFLGAVVEWIENDGNENKNS